MRLPPLLLYTLFAVAAATAAPPDHRADGDAVIAARRVLLKYCADCHGSQAKDHRGRLWVDDYGRLTGHAQPVPFVSLDDKDDRSQVVDFLEDGSMPPGNRPRPTRSEIDAVKAWVKLKAEVKAFPARLDDDGVLRLIADDFARHPPKPPGSVRYVSVAHLAEKPDADPTALAKADAALAAALSRPQAEAFGTVLTPVPGSAGTVYRLDLAALGWDGGGKNLFHTTKAGKTTGDQFRMIPFDLIQLEYPYTHATRNDDLKKVVAATVGGLNAHRKGEKDPLAQLRAVPFVRGDWLAAALRQQDKPTPLADELDWLTKLAAALGPDDVFADLDEKQAPPFAPFVGGPKVKDADPSPWAWYQPRVAPTPPPFDFKVQSTAAGPVRLGTAVTITAQADRPAHVTYVEVFADDYARQLDLLSGKQLAKDTPTPVAPNEKGKIVLNGPAGGGSVFFLLYASAEPLRELVLVRSRHKTNAVWRVLPHELDAADPDLPPLVRAVVEVTVAR